MVKCILDLYYLQQNDATMQHMTKFCGHLVTKMDFQNFYFLHASMKILARLWNAHSPEWLDAWLILVLISTLVLAVIRAFLDCLPYTL